MKCERSKYPLCLLVALSRDLKQMSGHREKERERLRERLRERKRKRERGTERERERVRERGREGVTGVGRKTGKREIGVCEGRACCARSPLRVATRQSAKGSSFRFFWPTLTPHICLQAKDAYACMSNNNNNSNNVYEIMIARVTQH